MASSLVLDLLIDAFLSVIKKYKFVKLETEERRKNDKMKSLYRVPSVLEIIKDCLNSFREDE